MREEHIYEVDTDVEGLPEGQSISQLGFKVFARNFKEAVAQTDHIALEFMKEMKPDIKGAVG